MGLVVALLQHQMVTPAWVNFALKLLAVQADLLISVPLAVQLDISYMNIIDLS